MAGKNVHIHSRDKYTPCGRYTMNAERLQKASNWLLWVVWRQLKCPVRFHPACPRCKCAQLDAASMFRVTPNRCFVLFISYEGEKAGTHIHYTHSMLYHWAFYKYASYRHGKCERAETLIIKQINTRVKIHQLIKPQCAEWYCLKLIYT